MGKQIEKSSMDKLLFGLTKETEPNDSSNETSPSTEKVQQNEKKKDSVSEERICTIVDVEKMGKIRAISDKEGVSIKDIISYAFDVIIDKYEELHGTVRTKKTRKANVKNVFNVK